MTTRADIRGEVQSRLGDTTEEVWSEDELNGIIDYAIKGLYPTFYEREVAETTADDGPLQDMPSGARNLYMIGHKRADSTRVRSMRRWREGQDKTFISRTGISGDTIIWAWTRGWDAPSTDGETIDLYPEAEEVVVLRTMVAALEMLLTDRVSKEKYHAVQLREGVTEEDVDLLISNLRDSIEERVRNTQPLPEIDRL